MDALMVTKKRFASNGGEATKAKRAKRSFEDLLAHAAPVRDVCRALRDLVRAAVPQAVEGIYGGAKVGLALYSIAEGKQVICGIQPSGDDCLFYVHNVKPEDSSHFKLEGQGKHARHIKLRMLNDERRAELVALIRLALSRC
jgi:hypothetical protein